MLVEALLLLLFTSFTNASSIVPNNADTASFVVKYK